METGKNQLGAGQETTAGVAIYSSIIVWNAHRDEVGGVSCTLRPVGSQAKKKKERIFLWYYNDGLLYTK